MKKKTKFVFTERLAYELVRIPADKKHSAFAYAMNYGLGRMEAADDEMLDPITREIDRIGIPDTEPPQQFPLWR